MGIVTKEMLKMISPSDIFLGTLAFGNRQAVNATLFSEIYLFGGVPHCRKGHKNQSSYEKSQGDVSMGPLCKHTRVTDKLIISILYLYVYTLRISILIVVM